MPAFRAAGVQVYALSYDEPEALKDFAQAHNIAYRFLSDPDSQVIREFGILNTIIPPDDHPWFGIPYPGTYLLDADGLITHKFFENNLAVRVGPNQLLRAIAGDEPAELHEELLESRSLSGEVDGEVDGKANRGVAAEVFLAGNELAVSVQSELVARFSVPAGRHLYAEPAPAGTIAVALELDPIPGLVRRPLQRPQTQLHHLRDTDESFPVHHGTVELRLPLTINGDAFVKGGGREMRLTGRLCWQSCDDDVCDIPVNRPFELVVPLNSGLPSIFEAADGDAATEPRGQAHFQQMIERRKRR